MDLDLDLYRRELRVSSNPRVRLSAIDVSPERPLRTFVFIHGFGGEAEQWQYQLQSLLIENRVIALDLRGHGLSDRPGHGYDMAQICSDLETSLNLLNVKGKFVLVGHSFGGAIVTEYALAHPERIERLVLIATPGEFKLAPLFALGLALPNWLLRPAAYFLRKRLAAPAYVLKSFYLENLSKWVGWDQFRRIGVPTLVIRGHRDAVFERAFLEDVTGYIPDAQEADIGGSGHLVMLERREAVNRAIQRFVQGEQQRSWRDASLAMQSDSSAVRKRGDSRDALRKERPWLLHYEPGVPYTTAVPSIPSASLVAVGGQALPAASGDLL